MRLTTYYLRLTTYDLLRTAYYLLLNTYCSLLTTYYLSLTLIFTIYYLLLLRLPLGQQHEVRTTEQRRKRSCTCASQAASTHIDRQTRPRTDTDTQTHTHTCTDRQAGEQKDKQTVTLTGIILTVMLMPTEQQTKNRGASDEQIPGRKLASMCDKPFEMSPRMLASAASLAAKASSEGTLPWLGHYKVRLVPRFALALNIYVVFQPSNGPRSLSIDQSVPPARREPRLLGRHPIGEEVWGAPRRHRLVGAVLELITKGGS